LVRRTGTGSGKPTGRTARQTKKMRNEQESRAGETEALERAQKLARRERSKLIAQLFEARLSPDTVVVHYGSPQLKAKATNLAMFAEICQQTIETHNLPGLEPRQITLLQKAQNPSLREGREATILTFQGVKKLLEVGRESRQALINAGLLEEYAVPKDSHARRAPGSDKVTFYTHALAGKKYYKTTDAGKTVAIQYGLLYKAAGQFESELLRAKGIGPRNGKPNVKETANVGAMVKIAKDWVKAKERGILK